MRIEKEKHLDDLIDQALREFPLEPAPDQLKARIMERIQHPVIAPRFRISWIDIALSGTMALIFGFALDSIQGIARSPYWSARLRVGFSLYWQDMRYFLLHNQPSITAVLLSTAVVVSLMAILASVYRHYIVGSARIPV